jgi:ribose transport system ATP-binding protein
VTLSASPQETVLGVSNVSKIFGDQIALDDVDLSIRAGQIHGLAGHNGSGKSTLIRILAGYHSPDAGARLELDGTVHAWGDAPHGWRDNLRFVHQDLGLVPTLDAAENFAIGSDYARRASGRIDWSAQVRKTTDALAKLDVYVDVRRPVAQLSTVDRTMVAIARAFDALPTTGVLVLDEPTAALTQLDAERLFRLIRRITAHGACVLFVTHHLDELVELSDHVTVLRNGRVAQSAARGEVTRHSLTTAIAGVPELGTAPERYTPTSTGSSRLQVTGLGGGSLAPLTFQMSSGEVLGFAGLTGSGRDDVAPLLTGARAADTGSLTVDGTTVSLRSPRAAMKAGIAHVPANRHADALFPKHSIAENLVMPRLAEFLGRIGINRAAERRSAMQSLAQADVRPLLPDRLITQFSGGNQQKAVLARCLHAEPKLLVLDETTQGVDVGARAALREQLIDSAKHGTCIIACSSDNEELAALCDRVIVLARGRVADTLSGSRLTPEHLAHACLGQASDHEMATNNA